MKRRYEEDKRKDSKDVKREDGRRRDGSRDEEGNEETKQVEKERPNYEQSGLLAAEMNTVNGVVLKYQEPPEARVPDIGWRMYVFKGKEEVAMYKLSKQSAHLMGRERKVVDIATDHPSCSKQHAVVQFRRVDDNLGNKVIRPYLIDLGSANGSFLNGSRLDDARYYQLKHRDILKFGASSREYVLLKED